MNKQLLKIWSEIESKLLAFIKKRINNSEDAEDILQDVYLKLHQNISLLKNEEKFISWIYQITRNTINDCYKKCYKIKLEELEDNQKFLFEEETNLNEEILKYLKDFINKMPKNDKEIIFLFEFENLSHKEISEKLNISENLSKVRLNRAKAKLKRELEKCCTFEYDKYGNILEYKNKKTN